jgi:hypothetical protein
VAGGSGTGGSDDRQARARGGGRRARLPGAALAAKPKKGYAVGQKCTVKKEATYVAHKFMCVNGRLQVKK